MLSREDNELLTRVGPGTPMGQVIRSYWLPILLTRELEADGKALRLRIMGEDLVAYRDTNGTVGVLEELCAHRGASLYYGRNEECGLRCVYHGWKFDATGQCVDMPNEPSESSFKEKVKLTAYPTAEKSGIVWVYMGQQSPPPPPMLEWSTLPDSHVYASKVVEQCNWAQALEGGIDSSHISFLHGEAPNAPADPGRRQAFDRHPRYEVVDTAFGSYMSACRSTAEGDNYYRVTPFLMPFYTIIPGQTGDNSRLTGHAWLPIDDESTLVWTITWDASKPLSPEALHQLQHYNGSGAGNVHLPLEFLAPESPEAWGAWYPRPTRANDYLRDLEREKAQRFTGIPTIGVQDKAMQESMGRVFNRSRERLGSADIAIIKARQLWLDAARAMRDYGASPRGADAPEAYQVRSASAVLPREAAWLERMQPSLEAPRLAAQQATATASTADA